MVWQETGGMRIGLAKYEVWKHCDIKFMHHYSGSQLLKHVMTLRI